MNDPNITCPSCNHQFRLDESLAAPLIESTRQAFEKKLTQQNADIARREAVLRDQQAQLLQAKEALEDQLAKKLSAERGKIAAEQLKKAKLELESDLNQKADQLASLHELLKQRDTKLAEAQKTQAEFMQKQRDLDDARREMDLTIQKKVDESLSAVREKAKRDAENELKLKVLEKEITITSMARQIEELKRKAEQGSEQTQGEALEVQLESLLRMKFPRDTIDAVAKGESGGDVLQSVLTEFAQTAGVILWESKRTKSWNEAWLAKLRDDQRAANADFAVIVSQAMPKGIEGFDLVENVWVCEPRFAIPVAVALRQALLEIAAARQAAEGQQTKMEMVYHYLTGQRFRQRVNAIVEKFTDMQLDLDKERKAITKAWAKRQEQIHGVIEATAGMYGDLQGIAGKSLAEIDGLDMKLLEGHEG